MQLILCVVICRCGLASQQHLLWCLEQICLRCKITLLLLKVNRPCLVFPQSTHHYSSKYTPHFLIVVTVSKVMIFSWEQYVTVNFIDHKYVYSKHA